MNVDQFLACHEALHGRHRGQGLGRRLLLLAATIVGLVWLLTRATS